MNKTLRIFIVEDSKSMSSAIEKHLNKEFGNTIIVNQFETVEQTLESEKLIPEVMLLDHNLQESLGVDSIRSILKKFPELKIAVISGQTNLKVFANAYSNGATEYIRKDSQVFKNISNFINLILNPE